MSSVEEDLLTTPEHVSACRRPRREAGRKHRLLSLLLLATGIVSRDLGDSLLLYNSYRFLHSGSCLVFYANSGEAWLPSFVSYPAVRRTPAKQNVRD